MDITNGSSMGGAAHAEFDDGITEEDRKVVEALIEGLSGELPSSAWRVPLSYQCKERCKPFMVPRLSQLPTLAPIALRVFGFWLRKRVFEKRKPFIDMMGMLPHVPIYGVPLGGIGSGTIGRGYRGEFCRYQLAPGDYVHSVIETNHFIVTASRAGHVVYNRVLSVESHPPRKHAGLRTWRFAFPAKDAAYLALYPRSWTVYKIDELKLRLVCRQISPIIPHNYSDSCLPVSVFVWSVESYDESDNEPLELSITFTFKNGVGDAGVDHSGAVRNRSFSCPLGPASPPLGTTQSTSTVTPESQNQGHIEGTLIEQLIDGEKCAIVLAARSADAASDAASAHVQVSTCAAFDPNSRADQSSDLNLTALNSGAQFWHRLETHGRLLPVSREQSGGILGQCVETQKRDVCAATCATCTVKPRGRATLEFVLGWHMPQVHFKARGRKYKRRYARWFSEDLESAVQLARYAMQHYDVWEDSIERWQSPVLSDSTLPEWYKYALFNETYFLSDGGTIWLERHEDEHDSKVDSSIGKSAYACETLREMGHFAYLEGHEYRMFNTYDVHFYASYALLALFPKLQHATQLDMAKHALVGDSEMIKYVFTGERRVRLEPCSVPHDIGDPEDEPFLRVNGYGMSPSAEWKDLAPKFVLVTYRDALLSDVPKDYLRAVYPIAKTVFDSNLRLDTDGDGLPDHADVPDSTFDAWLLRGACVYTSVLWLSALYALKRMASILLKDAVSTASNVNQSERQSEQIAEQELSADVQRYQSLFEKCQRNVDEQFWNESGGYYQFATNKLSTSDRRREVVMAAALTGFWYLQTCAIADSDNGETGLNALQSVLSPDRVRRTLQCIYRANVCSIQNGQLGAINGAYPDGTPDISSLQSEEIWPGVVYSLASSMLLADLPEQAMKTAHGCFTACLRFGLHFQTPEAIFMHKRFRSLGYMRPLSIWSIQLAMEQRKRLSAASLKPATLNGLDD